MTHVPQKVAHITFTEGPYANRVYKLINPLTEPPSHINITDGGNTLETDDGEIIAHYSHMYDPTKPTPYPRNPPTNQHDDIPW